MPDCGPMTVTSAPTAIPDETPSTHTLPPGRHPTTLAEIACQYVDHARFRSSLTRRDVWSGFLSYVAAWELAERELGGQVVIAWWIGGSFISAKRNPEDVDVTPVLDQDFLDSTVGKPGMGHIKKLVGNRQSVRSAFSVEPFPLRWQALPATLFPDNLSPANQQMLAQRGGLDTWWQRLRPPGPKMAPTVPSVFAERGYLEVTR